MNNRLDIKQNIKLFALISVLPISVQAEAPQIDMLSPSAANIVYLSSFPATVPINFKVTHTTDDLSQVKVLKTKVDDSEIAQSGNPFTNTNPITCSADIYTGGYDTCSVSSDTVANVSKNWSVPQPGTYAITVSAKHQGATGEDEEQVSVELLTAEYPAPPAVANNYIKSKGYKLTGGCRGEIISAIANNHALDSRYGAKGGPYDDSLIKTDVDYLKTSIEKCL